jgi:hypothetical protein
VIKEAQKVLRYKDLTIEIQRMWNIQAKAKPLKVQTTRTISKSLGKYLSNIPEKQEIKELAKKNHIGHCTHTSESTNVKVHNLFKMRNNSTCSTNCEYRSAATLYTLETLFVSGM